MMEYEQLKYAINSLYDMEKNNYLMEQALSKIVHHGVNILNENDALYEKESMVAEPIKPKMPCKKDIKFTSEYKELMKKEEEEGPGCLYVVVIIICVLIGLAVAARIAADTGSVIEKVLGFIFAGGILGLIGGGIGLFFMGPLIVECRDNNRRKKMISAAENRVNEEYEQAVENYNKQLVVYKSKYKQYEQKQLIAEKNAEENLRKRNGERFLPIENERVLLHKRLEDSKKLTEKLYDFVGIEPEFRTLPVLGYMSDFLRLKVATKLEGIDGLYYLIRKEVSSELFLTKLQQISDKLDTIIDKQSAIYSALVELNHKCDDLVNAVIDTGNKIGNVIKEQGEITNEQMHDLIEKSEINNYNTERIAKENEYMRFMMEYDMISKYGN